MNESLVEDVMAVRGVTGVALIGSMGDVAASTIVESELNEFLGFLFGIAPVLGGSSDLGPIRGLIVKTDDGKHLSVFVEGDEALGVVYNHETSIRELRREIDELLLWG